MDVCVKFLTVPTKGRHAGKAQCSSKRSGGAAAIDSREAPVNNEWLFYFSLRRANNVFRLDVAVDDFPGVRHE